MNRVDTTKKNKMDRLQMLLKEYGINTAEELDAALKKNIEKMTLGIMTDDFLKKANSA